MSSVETIGKKFSDVEERNGMVIDWTSGSESESLTTAIEGGAATLENDWIGATEGIPEAIIGIEGREDGPGTAIAAAGGFWGNPWNWFMNVGNWNDKKHLIRKGKNIYILKNT